MDRAESPTLIYTPSQLTQELRTLLESALPSLWIEGEISNLARPASGHIYFTLKDANAQVRCALFRGRASALRHHPTDGDQVRLRARASLYPGRGEFQLIVEHLEPAGEGALQRAFEALKKRLAAEGLFDSELKRPLPAQPRRLGVVTSPSGAAIRDVLQVLQRRFPALPVRIYPVPVQGSAAAPAIANALELAGRRRDVDVLLLTRGGGSLEDLWPFNEEAVARALRACPLPVVSAVGHEVDVTIADLAADYRAPTPSAAAEALSPDGGAWLQSLQSLERRIQDATRRRLRQERHRVETLQRRLDGQHPRRRLRDRAQRLDDLEGRLQRTLQRGLAQRGERLGNARHRLAVQTPKRRIAQEHRRLTPLLQRRDHAIRQRLATLEQRLAQAGGRLETVSPLATLHRGYAVVQRADDGSVVRSAQSVTTGDALRTRVASGLIHCRVEATEAETDDAHNT